MLLSLLYLKVKSIPFYSDFPDNDIFELPFEDPDTEFIMVLLDSGFKSLLFLNIYYPHLISIFFEFFSNKYDFLVIISSVQVTKKVSIFLPF